MENLNPKSKIAFGIPIKILTISSIILAILCYVVGCLHYEYNDLNGIVTQTLKSFDFGFIDIFAFLIEMLPSVLFAVFVFQRCKKGAAFFTLTIAGMALNYFLVLLLQLVIGRLAWPLLRFLILCFAVYCCVKRPNWKIAVCIALAVSLIVDVIQYIRFLTTYEYPFLYLPDMNHIMSMIGSILDYASKGMLCTAISLYMLNNGIPPIIHLPTEKIKDKIEKMEPEKALKYLQEKRKNNMITEETYQEQRSEIISKL